jgi:hypothetical protein
MMNEQELKALVTLMMVSDPWPIDEDSRDLLVNFAEEQALKLGYTDFIDAYHSIN